jgi:hypothetical protein
MNKPDVSNFIEYLRPVALTAIIDKHMGISSERRAELDKQALERETYINARAAQLLKAMPPEDADVLAEYWGRE